MYGQLYKHGESRQIYKNVRNDYKITIGKEFRPIDQGFDGPRMFLVGSRRLSVGDVLLARAFLPGLQSLTPTVWEICTLYLSCLSGFLGYVVWRLQRRRDNLRRWSTILDIAIVEANELVRRGPNETATVRWPGRAVALMTIKASPIHAQLTAALDHAERSLRRAGWMAWTHSFDTLALISPPIAADGVETTTSPGRLLEEIHFELQSASALRSDEVSIIWDNGEITIEFGQPDARAIISGHAIDTLLSHRERLRRLTDWWGALWCLEEVSTRHRYQPIGDRRDVSGVAWRRARL